MSGALSGDEGRRGGERPLDLDAFARAIAAAEKPVEWGWRPVFVRIAASGSGALSALCREFGIARIDTIDRQLADLAMVRFPSSSAAGERSGFVRERVAEAGGSDAVGTWVYLPWDAKLVHLLAADEYFEVITDRNRDKITREEQLRLRGKRIAVLGLSVGGEAAVTVAQEHLCGRIVLADFDDLDLSNLNRLNAGCDELGLPKTTIVARRIARIDPYIDVSVFANGVTAENASAFLDGVDLLLEECDGLTIKYEIRRLTSARGIDVVFAGDERGFLSVEPYASHRELAPFHGRITAAPPPREAFQTPLDFMKALAEWLGGWDRLSNRSRQSLEQIGQTLCGYPQLASEARYAAGQIGHVARRLLLGERLTPGIHHIDLEAILPVERDA